SDEQFMFHAFASSLSSGALGRQVGAVLVAPTREVLGVGWNDVPKGGGGLYRAGEHYDQRDIHADRDSVNVHADQILEEMLAAARIGASPRDATLYTTTFPCHQCARLIVTAGIRKVVYIEPYPKSRALDLHRDAIVAYDDATQPECGKRNCNDSHAVRFEPF